MDLPNAQDTTALESCLPRVSQLLVPVSVQLGHQRMPLKSLCELAPGSIIPLDMPCQTTQVLVANGLKLATGQVVRSGTRLGFRLRQAAIKST